MYAIVDIETTGGSSAEHRITEISVILHNGNEITDKFTSLINPEAYITPFITRLTGITNKMVNDAPKFYNIAKKIVEITENKIFIAHNVNFDYGFIRAEFKRLGYDYTRDKLCTVQLSKKLIPGLKSYSLGVICNHLNIEIENRHRAEGDALATVKLFEYLLNIDKSNRPLLASLK